MKSLYKVFLATLLTTLLSQASQAHQFSIETIGNVQIFYFSGLIELSTPDDFTRFFNTYGRTDLPLIIDFNSVGGDIDATYSTMLSFNEIKMKVSQNTGLPVYGHVEKLCASACTALVLYLKETASPEGLFGFHAASRSGVIARDETDSYIDFLRDMGVAADWLTNNDSLFRTTSLTWIFAEKLAQQGYGAINSENLITLADLVKDLNLKFRGQ